MAAKKKSDVCDFMDDGRVKLAFGGTVRTLRRPTIGESKRFNQLLMEIASQQKSIDTSNPTSEDLDAAFSSTLLWWSEVINELRDENDLPAPEDPDDFPMWMLSPDLLVKIQTHWREVPWASGGN